ncbi:MULTISPECIES: hypothetical protein [unclassified Blastococcus]
MTVLLVDVANLLGSRPDGWWRDRAGATTRLLAGLAALPGRELDAPDGGRLTCTGVVAVVEGAARGVPEPAGVRLVRAPGSGDDALVAEAAARADAGDLLVVTADRGLRARLPAGTAVAGPGWLRARLPSGDGTTG